MLIVLTEAHKQYSLFDIICSLYVLSWIILDLQEHIYKQVVKANNSQRAKQHTHIYIYIYIYVFVDCSMEIMRCYLFAFFVIAP